MSTETVPKGYKRTEVGVIPEEWGVTTVGAEFSMQLGKMLDSEKNLGVEKPFLGNRSVQWSKIDCSDLGLIKLTSSDLQKYRLHIGDILVCEGGEIGRSAIWEQQIDECYFQKALHRLRPKNGFSASLFVNLLQRYATTGYLQNFVTQTSIAHLPKDKFETIQIPAIPKVEQQAIAAALSDADALIESLEQLLAKKRQIKQGAMQELLTGKRRLPGVSGKWELVPLGKEITLLSGHHVLAQYCNTEVIGFPYITGPSDFATASIQITKFTTRPTAICEPHDILITVKGSGVGSMIVADGQYCISRQLMAIRVSSNWSSSFIYYRLRQESVSFGSAATGLIPGISRSDLLEKTVLIPQDLHEQSAIASVLSDMDAELEVLVGKLEKARQVKQGMMQQLLTGKIRLVGIQSQKAEASSRVAAEPTSSNVHQPFNEAVLISVLAGRYGKSDFPLSRFRYTKFLYLFHRHVDHVAQGFRKKAAGPYNPDNRYKGPEGIAQKSGYMVRSGNGFVAGPKKAEAIGYYEKWYPVEHLAWLDQFRFEKNDALEVLTTVDMACEDLRNQGKVVSVQSVKALIASEPEWRPKLDRDIFSDTGIAAAIRRSQALFGEEA